MWLALITLLCAGLCVMVVVVLLLQGATLRKLPKCRARLFEAVCSVISSLPAQHCLLYAQQFSAPHLARLEQLATAGVSDIFTLN